MNSENTKTNKSQLASLEISVEEVIQFRKQMFLESTALIEKKGHDYNREQQRQGNTLFNLTICELLGIATTEQGILTRLSDKFMRLVSLSMVDIQPQVEDETLEQTVQDAHNYMDYLLLIRNKKRALLKPKVDKSLTHLATSDGLALCGVKYIDGMKFIPLPKQVTCDICLGLYYGNAPHPNG